MEEELIEIQDYQGEGFRVLISFGAWRVAVLRYLDEIQPEKNASLERHTQTDEVFILTQGRGVLILGGNGPRVEHLVLQPLAAGKVYNVRRDVWHTVLLSRDATVLIVENQDTGTANTEYLPILPDLRQELVIAAREAGID